MSEQLKLKLFEDLGKTDLLSKPIFYFVDKTKDLAKDIVYKDDYENPEQVVKCPNCENQYIDSSWCDCWYWVDMTYDIDIDIDIDIEKKIDIYEELLYLESISAFKNTFSKSIWKLKFPILNKKETINEQKVFIDVNNIIMTHNWAILYSFINNSIVKIICSFETIYQSDENYRVDKEKPKIVHYLKLITFEFKNWKLIEFKFLDHILQHLKFLLTLEILNKPEYNNQI